MATFNGQVSASADDGYFDGSSRFPTESFLGFGDASGSSRGTWLRFTNVTIPQGSTITSAVLSFRAFASSSSATVNVTIRCFDADDAGNPADISEYNGATTDATNWNSVGSWTAGTWYDSPDVTTPLQAIINRPGFASGNAVVFRIANNSSSTNARRAPYAYDGGSSSAATLTVNYDEGSAIPVFMHHYRQQGIS